MTAVERAARLASWFVAAAVVVFLLGPLVVTVVVSFTSSSIYTLPPPEWSLRWYASLSQKSGLRRRYGCRCRLRCYPLRWR